MGTCLLFKVQEQTGRFCRYDVADHQLGQYFRQAEYRTKTQVVFTESLLPTSATMNFIALGGNGDTQLTFISQSVYFFAAGLFTELMKKSASQITGIILPGMSSLLCNSGIH